MKFCSIDNLRRELAKGRERIYLNYRTLIKQEYRWVCMEVIRSAEYKPDDQIAMMYIRDINDEYLKQLDKIIRHAKDAFCLSYSKYFGWKLYYGKQQDCFTGAERCK